MAAILAIALLASPSLACFGGLGSLGGLVGGGGGGCGAPSCAPSYAAPGAAYPRAPIGYAQAPPIAAAPAGEYAQAPTFAAAPASGYVQAPSFGAAPAAGGYAQAPSFGAAPAAGAYAQGPSFGAAPVVGGYAQGPSFGAAPVVGGYAAPGGFAAPSVVQVGGPVAAGFGGNYADAGYNQIIPQHPVQPQQPEPHHDTPGGYNEGQLPQPVVHPTGGDDVQVVQPTVTVPEVIVHPTIVVPTPVGPGHVIEEGYEDKTVPQPVPGVAPFAQPSRTTVTANRATIITENTVAPATLPSGSHNIATETPLIQTSQSKVFVATAQPVVQKHVDVVETVSKISRPTTIVVTTSAETKPVPEEFNIKPKHIDGHEIEDIDSETSNSGSNNIQIITNTHGESRQVAPNPEERVDVTESKIVEPELLNPEAFFVPSTSTANRQQQIHVEPATLAPYNEGPAPFQPVKEPSNPREIPYEIPHPIQPGTGHPEPVGPAEPHPSDPIPVIEEYELVDPIAPVHPTRPVEPVHPTRPVEPVHPIEPVHPAEPTPIIPYHPDPEHHEELPEEIEEEHIEEEHHEEEHHEEEHHEEEQEQEQEPEQEQEQEQEQEEEEEGYNNEHEEEHEEQPEEQPEEEHEEEQPIHDEPEVPAPLPAITPAPQQVPAATENYNHQGSDYSEEEAHYDDIQPEPVKEEKTDAPYKL